MNFCRRAAPASKNHPRRLHSSPKTTHAGIRTRVTPVKAECPNRLDYEGVVAKSKAPDISELCVQKKVKNAKVRKTGQAAAPRPPACISSRAQASVWQCKLVNPNISTARPSQRRRGGTMRTGAAPTSSRSTSSPAAAAPAWRPCWRQRAPAGGSRWRAVRRSARTTRPRCCAGARRSWPTRTRSRRSDSTMPLSAAGTITSRCVCP